MGRRAQGRRQGLRPGSCFGEGERRELHRWHRRGRELRQGRRRGGRRAVGGTRAALEPPRAPPWQRRGNRRDPARDNGRRACRPCVRGRLCHGIGRLLAHRRGNRPCHAGGRARHRERRGQPLPVRALGHCHRRAERLLHPRHRRGRGAPVLHERELRLGHGLVLRGPDDAPRPQDRGLLRAGQRGRERASYLGPLLGLCQDRHHPPPAGGHARARHPARALLCHGEELQGAHRARPARGGPGGACGRRVAQRRRRPGDARGLRSFRGRARLRREDPLCPGGRRGAACPRGLRFADAFGPHRLAWGRGRRQGRRHARAPSPGAPARRRLRRQQGLRRPSPQRVAALPGRPRARHPGHRRRLHLHEPRPARPPRPPARRAVPAYRRRRPQCRARRLGLARRAARGRGCRGRRGDDGLRPRPHGQVRGRGRRRGRDHLSGGRRRPCRPAGRHRLRDWRPGFQVHLAQRRPGRRLPDEQGLRRRHGVFHRGAGRAPRHPYCRVRQARAFRRSAHRPRRALHRLRRDGHQLRPRRRRPQGRRRGGPRALHRTQLPAPRRGLQARGEPYRAPGRRGV